MTTRETILEHSILIIKKLTNFFISKFFAVIRCKGSWGMRHAFNNKINCCCSIITISRFQWFCPNFCCCYINDYENIFITFVMPRSLVNIPSLDSNVFFCNLLIFNHISNSGTIHNIRLNSTVWACYYS